MNWNFFLRQIVHIFNIIAKVKTFKNKYKTSMKLEMEIVKNY